MKYKTSDSGDRKDYPSGMRRDVTVGKPRYDLIYQPMLKRLAELMARGAEKYGARNWQKAKSKAEMEHFKESAYRHFFDWYNDEGLKEDHASAISFNVFAVEKMKDDNVQRNNKERQKK